MTTQDMLSGLNTIADNNCDLGLGMALREAQTALKRLAAIRAAHEAGAVTTDGGRVIHASIHGHRLDQLLYGDISEF